MLNKPIEMVYEEFEKVGLKIIPSYVGANLVFALSPVFEVISRANTRFAPTKRTITLVYHRGRLVTAGFLKIVNPLGATPTALLGFGRVFMTAT